MPTPTPEVMNFAQWIDASVVTLDMFGITPALAFFVVFVPAAAILWHKFKGSRS